MLVLDELARLAVDEAAAPQVRALAHDAIAGLDAWLEVRADGETDADWGAHYRYARTRIELLEDEPQLFRDLPGVAVPPGSPIGGH